MKKLLLLFAVGITTAMSAQLIPSYVPTDNLVGWWPFNGNANDLSPNGNNGNVNGAILATDRFGNPNSSYDFDGIDDYINVPYSTSLGIQQFFTSSVWIYMDGGSCNPRVYEIHESLNCGGYTLGFNGTGSGTRTFNTAGFGSCATSNIVSNTNTAVSTNTWHHLATVFDGVNGTGKLYLDGNLIHTTNGSVLPQINYYGAALCIGNIAPNRCDWWGGQIDDIGFWNRALTPAEIQGLYKAQSIGFNPVEFEHSIKATENASLLVDIDVDLDIDLDGQILRISSEEVRKGYVLVISRGNAFEERYFLNPEPMLNTYELLLWGAGGGNAFNEAVMESGFYEECFGEKYGEVTFKKGALEMTFLPQCNSFIAPFYISAKI